MASAAQRRQREIELQNQARAREQTRANQYATLRAGHSPFQPFRPYQPPPVPTGTYDPALEAQLGAANRGYGDLRQDTALAQTRGAEDYGFGLTAADTSLNRGLADIATQRGYENQDYTRNTDLLARSFQQLARQQTERARQYGVVSGGIALLSAAKRQENQGLAQQGLDLTHARTFAGLDTTQTRLGENRDTTVGQLAVGYNRGIADQTTALARAGRENTQFGLDVGAQKAYQAGQAGYVAPLPGEPGGMPRNERVRAGGQHTRTATIGNIVYAYGPTGKIISKRRVK